MYHTIININSHLWNHITCLTHFKPRNFVIHKNIQTKLECKIVNPQFYEKLCYLHGGPHHLSTIPLKESHLFKTAESIISFSLKIFFDSTILNKWESFSGIVDHVTCPSWGSYNFSRGEIIVYSRSTINAYSLLSHVWEEEVLIYCTSEVPNNFPQKKWHK